MSTIALALHVVRRDLTGNRWVVAGWLILVALATFEAVGGVRVPEAPAARHFFLPLGALFLASGIVQVYPPGGSPPGTPVYWRTLPIPLRALLLARIAAAAVLLLGFPLAGQAVALVALDTPVSDIPGHLVSSAIPLGGVVLGGLLLGSLTRGIGGTVVLCTGLFILLFPLTLLRFVVAPLPGLLPQVPGIAIAVHLGLAGLALWILALRHALDPGNGWTRTGAVVVVLVLVGVSQSGLFVTVSETRAGSSVPAQAGVPGFPVAVTEFRLTRDGLDASGTPSTPGGADREGLAGPEASVEARFRVAAGGGVPTPSLVLVHLVTLEDTRGNVLLRRRNPGRPPMPRPTDAAVMEGGLSMMVQVSFPLRYLAALRSGTVSMVLHGEGVELKPEIPVELPLEAGARLTQEGTRIAVDEVVDGRITVRWSAFASMVPTRVPGPARAAMSEAVRTSLVGAELLTGPGGDRSEFLSRRGSGGSPFSDLVLAGPNRSNSAISFAVPSPIPPASRLRVHVLKPFRATPFRLEIPVSHW